MFRGDAADTCPRTSVRQRTSVRRWERNRSSPSGKPSDGRACDGWHGGCNRRKHGPRPANQVAHSLRIVRGIAERVQTRVRSDSVRGTTRETRATDRRFGDRANRGRMPCFSWDFQVTTPTIRTRGQLNRVAWSTQPPHLRSISRGQPLLVRYYNGQALAIPLADLPASIVARMLPPDVQVDLEEMTQ